jgi:hypothetical protein
MREETFYETQYRTLEKYVVYVDNAREAQMIITTAPYPGVLTTNAKKMSPGHNDEQEQ